MHKLRLVIPLVSVLVAACGERSPTTPPPPQEVEVCSAGAELPSAQLSPQPRLDPLFEAAAREFGVPEALLKAIGYVETRWQMVAGHPEMGQPAAFGVMALRAGELGRAAALAGVSERAARTDPDANIRAAAALLRAYAAELELRPLSLGAWAPAVARYSGIELPEGRARYVHDDVYATLRRGAESAAAKLAPLEVQADFPAASLSRAGAGTLDYAGAVWRPSSNFNARPGGDIGRVAMVIIHSCEGAYTGCWSWLANPASRVSAHYVVREDGAEITQLVRESERAWHIGSAYDCTLNAGFECWRNGQSNNHFTIGVEHGGYASQGSWPAAQIDASARLVCDVTRRQGIARDNIHIVSHAQLQPHNRTDPGPNWPWAEYRALINRYCADGGGGGVVVDDDNRRNDPARAQLSASGQWVESSATPGYHGGGYRFAPTADVNDPAVFSFFMPAPGDRTLESWWAAHPRHTPRATLLVLAPDGRELGRVEVNQQRDGSRWNTLGTWNFPAGWNQVQISRRGPAGCVVVADALRVR